MALILYLPKRLKHKSVTKINIFSVLKLIENFILNAIFLCKRGIAMVNLFTNQPGFEKFEKSADKLNALKRGCYNKKPKPIDPYTELNNIYIYISGFFVRPNFPEKEDEVVFLDGFKLTVDVYTSEAYIYQGAIYRGEDFISAFAELEGTENFSLDERLKLHRDVQGYLKANATLKEAYDKVKPEIVRLKEKYDQKRKELLQEYEEYGGDEWQKLMG